MPDRSVQLIYLDPPFGSGGRYRTFSDRWRWDEPDRAAFDALAASPLGPALSACRELLGEGDLLAYLVMLAPRLLELRRVLAPSGSIYLHCDPTSAHYIKILMDAVFGRVNFRNEIIWAYGGRGAKSGARQLGRNHDVILLYSCDPSAAIYRPQTVRRRYSAREARHLGWRQDEAGRWFKTAPRGDYTDASLVRLDAAGRVHRTHSGHIRIKYFLETEDDMIVDDVLLGDTWTDIPDAMHLGHERTGYPTQKPLALLRRIILAGSDRGDVVLDPFCGSGTTLVAAAELGRAFIGMDLSEEAIRISRERIIQL
ncbi:MAG TPA: site-specific DNA-methyltransferase [Chloroflexota bacterium]|nr:site-specific DNA-methyltransferase [Chloroflexota bacterium]